jgi:PAS domain S-box-containing protein
VIATLKKYFNFDGLALRLILALILFSSLITTLITAFDLYSDYSRDISGIDNRMHFIKESYLPTLVESVWVADSTQINTQLEGLVRLQDIEYLDIIVAGQKHWSAGQFRSARRIETDVPLVRNYRGRDVSIGTLHIVASVDNVLDRLWSKLIATLLRNLAKTLLIAAFMLYLFQRLAGRHLKSIAQYMLVIGREPDIKTDLQLERPVRGRWRPDVLDNLSQAINTMRNNLRSAYAEMKQQNEYIKLLLASTTEAIYGADAKGICTFVNPACLRMLGYKQEEELIGKSIHELIHHTYPDGRPYPKDQCKVRLASLQGLAGHADDEVHWRADGSSFPVEYWSHPMYQDGQLVGTVVAFTDITERKRTETDLKNLNEELETRVTERTIEMKLAMDEAKRASIAKSEFLSRMSHELRTPLNAILGFGQLLGMDKTHPLSELQAENVHEILHAGNHLLELINEVLDLSRIESGHLEVSLEPVDAVPLIKTCVTQITPLASQKQIKFALELSGPCIVLGDMLRLREVIINLLSNAIKYNREGGEIHISCVPAGKQRVRFNVRDTGRGISAASLPRLFKPFERLESAYDGIEGTGIGLALTKKLVEAMHGEIGVESAQDLGSTFWFELPLTSLEIYAASHTPDLSIQAVHTPGANSRVLYIEDNPANLLLMRKITELRKNMVLLEAVSAESGLLIAETRHPDIILLDINLPGMDGYDALRRLRGNPLTRDIPVVAVSANAMLKDIEKGRAAGFNDYITKPVDVKNLFSILDRLLHRPNNI